MTTPRRTKHLLPLPVRLLPRGLRHAILRKKAVVDAHVVDQLVVEVAHTRQMYAAAFGLVHDAYVSRGWIKRTPSGLLLTEHHALPGTTVFVLRRGRQWLGTASLVLDSPLLLPLDRTFPETQELRRPGRRIAEIGSLAVAAAQRGTGVALCLIASMWRYAVNVAGVNHLVIAVDAHMREYFEALFGCAAEWGVRSYQGFLEGTRKLEEDLVVGMNRDIGSTFEEAHWRSFSDTPGKLNLGQLMTMAPFPAPWEVQPPPASDSLSAARHKLPREVFQEFFASPTAPQPLEERTRELLLQLRTPQTVLPSTVMNERLQERLSELRARDDDTQGEPGAVL